MTVRNVALYAGALFLVFLAGRAMHDRGPRDAAPPRGTVAHTLPDAVAAVGPRAVRARGGVPAGAGGGRSLQAGLANRQPKTDFERRVLASLHDSPEMRDLRNDVQRTAMRQAAPWMSDDELAPVLAINDAEAEERRAARAGFLLGELDEPAYFEELKRELRETTAQLQAMMSPEDYEAAFHWKHDSDPFDPEGAIASAALAPDTPAVVGPKIANHVTPRAPGN